MKNMKITDAINLISMTASGMEMAYSKRSVAIDWQLRHMGLE